MSNNEKPPSNTNGANTDPGPSNPSNPNTSNTSTTNPNSSNTSTNSTTNTNSLTSRIQSSASNLARSTLSSTPADVTSSLPGTSKSGSSRPGAGQAYYTETAPGTGSSLGSGFGFGSGSRAGTGVESFRSTGSTGHEGVEDVYSYGFPGAEAEAETGASSSAEAWMEERPRPGIETRNGKGKERETFEQVWTSTQRQYSQHGQNQTQQGSYQENAADGADVLTLLASPSFNPDFPDDEQGQIPNDLSDYQARDTGLSAEEIQMLDSFRRPSQHPPGQNQGQDRGGNTFTQKSLIPDIDTFLSSLPAQTRTSETDLRDAVLTGLSGAEDWVAVEERYQDEVWGFLKPVLQAAAAEMESRRDEDQAGLEHGQDGPAVARLKMILMHMRA